MPKKKRKATGWRKLRNAIAVRLIRFADRTVPRYSLETVQRLGAFLGKTACRFPSEKKRRARINLQIAFPDDSYPPTFRKKVLKESFASTGKVFFESVWIPSWKDDEDWRVEFLNEEYWTKAYNQAREEKRGIVLMSAHLGAWELFTGYLPRKLEVPCMGIASEPKLPELEEMLRNRREHSGGKIVYRGEAGVAAMRHLRGGGLLAMLVDHNLRGQGVGVPFFGKPAHTILAPARLALQSNAIVVTMFALRDGYGRLLIQCDEPIDLPKYAKDREERFRQEADLAAEYTTRIEAAIRRHPGQYLWMHRRWYERSDTLPLPADS